MPLDADDSREIAWNGTPVTGTPAVVRDSLFAPSDGKLLRARIVAGRVTQLRAQATDDRVVAVATGPAGYLVVLYHDGSAFRLAYLHPGQADQVLVSYPVPDALRTSQLVSVPATSQTPPVLAGLVLSGDEPGVYALQITRLDGEPVVDTELTIATDKATAIAATPDGALLVTTATGELLRYTPAAYQPR